MPRPDFRALSLSLALCLTLPLSPSPAMAEDSPPAMAGIPTETFLPTLSAHADLRFRIQGLQQLDDGRTQAAIEAFEAAARYADKPSQALLAELYWKGELVEQDRALAYVWMDLAAERLYKPFLALREHYWAQLNPTERSRVEEIGLGYYERFGDEVAKPRLETRLRRERRNIVGSRTGFRGNVTVYVPGPEGQWMSFSGEQYYSDTFWKPENYWRWVDETWTDPPRGNVDVGPLEARSEASD